MRAELELNNIRSNLIRLEETIIFAFIERSQFGKNLLIYKNGGIEIPDFNSSFMIYLLHETEKNHARVRRYTAPDEHPFTDDLPQPFLTPMVYEWPIKKTNININKIILDIYISKIIPLICIKEDDGNFGSSAVNDIYALQSLSKRIHYGKFVAESKYLTEIDEYNSLIKSNNKEKIMEKLTDKVVENRLLERVKLKASTYGQEPNAVNPEYKIKPDVIKSIYADYIIPLTKEVEYLYLMERADKL